MGLQIIGAGFGRTGTLSLKGALEQLGFGPCYHMMEVQQHPEHVAQWRAVERGEDVDWDQLFDGYQATVDWPSCNYWEQQLARYPQAKVILSQRESIAWHKSVMNTIYPVTIEAWARAQEAAKHSGEMDVQAEARYRMTMELIWDGVFHGRIDDAEYACGVFDAHNARVKTLVPAAQLLVYQPGDGWEPLCDFLGCEILETPYPKVNTTEDFQRFARGK